MSSDSIISSDQGTGRVAAPKKTGFWYNWGPQAWIDMWMSNSMLVKKAMPIISHTFVPILRLSGDKEQVDRDYAQIKSRREVLRWTDSPREKWRKRYGNFVREVEWALLELRKYYSQKQYEEIVIGTSVALSYETSADFLKMMNSMSDKNRNKKTKPAKDGSKKPGTGRPTFLPPWRLRTRRPPAQPERAARGRLPAYLQRSLRGPVQRRRRRPQDGIRTTPAGNFLHGAHDLANPVTR